MSPAQARKGTRRPKAEARNPPAAGVKKEVTRLIPPMKALARPRRSLRIASARKEWREMFHIAVPMPPANCTATASKTDCTHHRPSSDSETIRPPAIMTRLRPRRRISTPTGRSAARLPPAPAARIRPTVA